MAMGMGRVVGEGPGLFVSHAFDTFSSTDTTVDVWSGKLGVHSYPSLADERFWRSYESEEINTCSRIIGDVPGCKMPYLARMFRYRISSRAFPNAYLNAIIVVDPCRA